MAAHRIDLSDLFSRHRLVLFDASCPLCTGFVRFVIRRDRRAVFRYVSAQSQLGQSILAHFRMPLQNWETNMLVLGGKPYLRSAAFLRIVGHLPVPWRWLVAGRVLPRGLLDWLYDRVARNRFVIFGRHDHCMMPTPDIAARFLG